MCTCAGTVTGFGLANPKLYGEGEQARHMLNDQSANRAAPASPTRALISGAGRTPGQELAGR